MRQGIAQLIRYLIVAVAAYFIDMGGYILLLKFNCSPIFANVIVKVFAAIFGFFAHRRFTYQIKNMNGASTHALKYFGLAAVYTPTSSVLLATLLFFWPQPVLAKLFCDIILFVAVYWICSKYTFLNVQPEAR